MAADTRTRLTDAAFALFEEQGFEATTVEDIAERAGVGRRTFFRTFASKEDVIFPDHDRIVEQVESLLAQAVTEAEVVPTLFRGARTILLHYLDEGDRARLRFSLTSSVTALRNREIASVSRYQRLFRHYLDEHGSRSAEDSLRADLLSGAVVTVHNHVLRRWLRRQSEQPLTEYDQATAGLAALWRFEVAAPLEPSKAAQALIVIRTSEDLDEVLPRLRQTLDGSSAPH
ncbi:TetR family transcriptional regulator [Jatrophihabitans telluris]|uniref:TetR family transcriptional regulator n=1 Tax=Jatrophihabitans telluris TaxID=2038343 RepID=A0ABY4R1B8_9ACTN|nr:TetR family transcriptional regulator [Jatrophihabitans telluris]UQX89046.1 TetR family transcriptional regulator [Jatrophihabitans telluris]